MKSILHIGYPKTATTTLQNYFSTQTEFFNAGRPSKNLTDEKLRLLWSPLISERDEISSIIGTLRQNKSPFILSEELILGSHRRYSEQHFIAEAFFQEIPDCKVLITVRNQYDILKSLYCSWATSAASALGIHIKTAEGLIHKNPTFEDWLKILKDNKTDTWGGMLFYDEIVNIWSKVYGSENIVVVPYEAYTDCPDLVDKAFQNSLGLTSNLVSEHFKVIRLRDRRSKTLMQSLKSNFHYIINKFTKNGMPNVPNPDQINDCKEVQNEISSIYSGSNRRLQRITQFDLKELGYFQ